MAREDRDDRDREGRKAAGPSRDDASHPRSIHALFGKYIDRLNAGETLDADEIRRLHPEAAEELIEQLLEFKAFGSADSGLVDTFGQYRILGELGRGGMGVVYEAQDPAMDRRVALKVLSSGLAIDERSVERFRREARIVGRLRHPAIVAVYGTGIEAGTPYIAMEYVKGESLEKILARKRPEPEPVAKSWVRRTLAPITGSMRADAPTVEVVPAVRSGPENGRESGGKTGQDAGAASWSPIPATTQEMDLGYCLSMAKKFAVVAEGLEHAHSQEVIHRDLKPSNLILDSDGNLRVLDFGLARIEGQDHLTGSREIVGTPRYMSPEQARAREYPIDHRTDIYSLGATLYEVLTLTPPFQGRTAEETLSHIVSREPRSPRQINPRIPRDLETITLKCLRKKPADRYASARAFADDLVAFSRGDPIKARPQSFVEKSVWWARQHRTGLAIAAVLVVAALFAVNSTLESRARRLIEYEDLVTAAAIKLERSGALVDRAGMFAWGGMSYNPYLLMGGLAGSWDVSEHLVDAVGILERAIDSVPDRPVAHYHLARALVILGEYDPAQYDRALKELETAIELGFVPAMVLKSTLLEQEGSTEEARATLEEARAAARREGSEDWIDSWLTADEATRRGDWSAAAEAIEELLRSEAETGKPLYLGSSVEFYMSSGVAYLQTKDYEKARDCFAAAKALRPGAVEPELFMGILHRALGEVEKADRVFEELYEREHSADVLSMITILHWNSFRDLRSGLKWAERMEEGFFREFWKANFLTGLGRAEEAIEVARRLPELKPDAPLAYFAAALVFNGAGDWENGRAMAVKAAELAPKSSVPLTVLAQALAMQEKYVQAMGALMRAAELEPNVPAPKYYLGMAFIESGRVDEGIRLVEEALELARSTRMGMMSRETAHFDLGRVYRSRGELGKAREHLEQAVAIGRTNHTLDPDWSREFARVQWDGGEKVRALRTLDEAFWLPLATPSRIAGLERVYRDYAESLRAELPTYRAIDLHVESDRTETLLGAESSWRFFRGVVSPGDKWVHPGYDDSAWETGSYAVGYGYEGLTTVLEDMRNSYTTVYLRAGFTVTPPQRERLRRIVLRVRADDGFVAYLNGEEIQRLHVDDRTVLPHDAVAETRVDKQLHTTEVELPPAMLSETGRNVLAIQGVNFNLESSDLALFVTLAGDRIPAREENERIVEEFRSEASGPMIRERLAYLRGRLLQGEGRHGDAVLEFSFVVRSDAAAILPRVALARSLRALGRREDAARMLHEVIALTSPGRRELWNEWLGLLLAEGGRRPEEIALSFPLRATDIVPSSFTHLQTRYYVEDVEWLLERLESREVISINCGGGEYRDPNGGLWGEDRFYRSARGTGHAEAFAEDVRETDRDPLYQTERTFRPGEAPVEGRAGYTIPLPSGRYRIALHFAETRLTEPRRRIFDVAAEGETILESFEVEPYATALIREFDLDVRDGLLELDFLPRRGDPTISAIEIRHLD